MIKEQPLKGFFGCRSILFFVFYDLPPCCTNQVKADKNKKEDWSQLLANGKPSMNTKYAAPASRYSRQKEFLQHCSALVIFLMRTNVFT